MVRLMAQRIFDISIIKGSVRALLNDKLLVLLAVTGLFLVLVTPQGVARAPALVDWPTIAALAGLLLLTKSLEVSGALRWLAEKVAAGMSDHRALALAMVAMSAVLSMLLTNDVALFVVVPVTLVMARAVDLPATRLIIFEALAVNAGSALTPIGNPQNLYLWQISKVSFAAFAWHMLPLVLILMVTLLALTALTFSNRPIAIVVPAEKTPIDRWLCGIALCLFPAFVYATNIGMAIPVCLVLLVLFACLRWRMVVRLDWALLATFILMFVDLGLLASLPVFAKVLEGLHLEVSGHLYWTGIALSQLISNVPATIALVPYSRDWRVLAYGVNVGGFGLFIGSLANLIALRQAGDRKGWLLFHAYGVPFLIIGAGVGYLILFGLRP